MLDSLIYGDDDKIAVVVCVKDGQIEEENRAVIDGFDESEGIVEAECDSDADCDTVLLPLDHAVLEGVISGEPLLDKVCVPVGRVGKAVFDLDLNPDGEAVAVFGAKYKPMISMRGVVALLERVDTAPIDDGSEADMSAHEELRFDADTANFSLKYNAVVVTQATGTRTSAMQSSRIVDVSR